MNERSSSTIARDITYAVAATAMFLGAYVGGYYYLPGPDSVSPFASIHHPTLFTRAYYRLFYPLRRVTESYKKSYSGSLAGIDYGKREFILQTTPTCGLFFRFSPADEPFLRSLKTGDTIHVLTESVPDPQAGFSHNELISVSR